MIALALSLAAVAASPFDGFVESRAGHSATFVARGKAGVPPWRFACWNAERNSTADQWGLAIEMEGRWFRVELAGRVERAGTREDRLVIELRGGDRLDIAKRGGVPGVVRERHGSESIDWDAHTDQNARPIVAEFTGSEQAVPRYPTTFATPVWEKARWRGPADSMLRAWLDRDALVVDVGDDIIVPVPRAATDAQFLAADHVEVWLSEDLTDDADADVHSTRLWQVGVGARADGSLDVRWLRAPEAGRALPVVSGGHPLRVVLPEWSERTLAVAYSDCDDARAGQQKLIATQRFHPPAPDVLGEPRDVVTFTETLR